MTLTKITKEELEKLEERVKNQDSSFMLKETNVLLLEILKKLLEDKD